MFIFLYVVHVSGTQVRMHVSIFTVAGLFPLKPVMLLMPCNMLLALLVLNCSSTLFLYCHLAALMDFLRF